MNLKTLVLSLSVVAGALAMAGAADDAAKTAAPDRQAMVERHEKMADLHKKVAECLKAGKPVDECHAAMAKECPMRGSGACPMKGGQCGMCMGMGGKGRGMGPGKGMGRGRGMGPGADAPAAAPPGDAKKP